MKRKLALILLAGILSCTPAATCFCSQVTESAESSEEAEEEVDPLTVQDDGYIVESEGYTCEVMWVRTEDVNLFGRIYYPEDFDPSKEYTTIVMNHGKTINCDIWHKAYAPALAQAGYVCYAFDCRSCTQGGRGCYSDLLPDGQETDVNTYSEDLNVVLDYIESLDYVDPDHLYLFGQSMGGYTIQNVASQRADEIAGLIVLYGAIGEEKESLIDDFETLKANPYNNGEVIFISGSEDGTVTPESNLANMEWYENATYVQISGASHGFGYMLDRASQICIDNVIDFIERTSNS